MNSNRTTSVQKDADTARYLFGFFEWIGRAMVDLGFGSFIEKFEEHYGKRWARILVGTVGFTAFVACISTIVALFINPVVSFVYELTTSAPDTAAGTQDAIATGTIIISGILCAGVLVGLVEARRRLRKVFSLLYELDIRDGQVLSLVSLAIRYIDKVRSGEIEDDLVVTNKVDKSVEVRTREILEAAHILYVKAESPAPQSPQSTGQKTPQ